MQRKTIIITILIFVVLAVSAAIAIPLIIDSQKSATLNLFVVPTDAKITIDGKEFKNGNYRLAPGAVTVSIEKDGFESKSLSVNLEPNKTTLVYLPLFCADSSLICYLNDEDNLEVLPYVASYSDRSQEISDFTRKISIKNILPITYSSYDKDNSYSFEINVKEKVDEEVILEITDFFGNGKELAYQIIKESGFEPKDYKIDYSFISLERGKN